MRNFYLYTGSVGWGHPEWEGVFYPEDLPEDWRLSFYNTQFRCVYLPYVTWTHASDEQVAVWLSETQDDFHFVLGRLEAESEDSQMQAARFGGRGKLEGNVEIVWLDAEVNLRELAGRIKQASEIGRALYLIAKPDGLAQLRQVGELLQVMGV